MHHPSPQQQRRQHRVSEAACVFEGAPWPSFPVYRLTSHILTRGDTKRCQIGIQERTSNARNSAAGKPFATEPPLLAINHLEIQWDIFAVVPKGVMFIDCDGLSPREYRSEIIFTSRMTAACPVTTGLIMATMAEREKNKNKIRSMYSC